MKAILEFNLPEDQKDFNRCNKATDMAIVLFDLVYNTRKHIENYLAEKEYDKYEALDFVFTKLYKILEEQGILIDDLIE